MNLLKTPAKWPKILLPEDGRAEADAAKAGKGGAVKGTGKTAARVPFDALLKSVRELGPNATIAAIAESGLRGRGGSGYPTADKWRAAASGDATRRFVVANGYGADPSSLTDATLMEANPAAVVEGAAIAAWAIGAEEAIIAVRAGSTAVIEALHGAIVAGLEAGVLGLDAMGTGRRLEIEVRTVQGAYMLGEETVLIKALEGKRGQPEQRPPHPTADGLWGMPTLVQNVQTLAAVLWIIRNGAAAFKTIGSAGEPGTILVDVRGGEKHGVAEVPLGTTLGEIAKLAGAPGAGHEVKAILVGGPSGGILPADRLSAPYTFEAIRIAGAHIGSGSVVIADERACVVDLARVLTRYCADEACGKTIPCRIGTARLAEIVERVTTGTSRARDLDLAVDLAADIVGSALCDHERLATLPLMSGLRYFGPEVAAHVERSECPAGVCRPILIAAAASTGRTSGGAAAQPTMPS
jgi:NADH:ubiquinone oxidoreductase subunit F (NADH-binding)